MTTIEDVCQVQVGERRPLKKIAEKTGIPKQTTSGWFRYQHFPRWETFLTFLEFFDEVRHRRHLEKLWKEAWPAEQRARSAGQSGGAESGAGQAVPDEATVTPGDGWRLDRRLRGHLRRWTVVVVTTLLVAATTAAVQAVWKRWFDDDRDGARRCAQVTAPTSAVYEHPENPKPIKQKFNGDQVRLVDIAPITVADVVYQAVALPAPNDSATGYGWMREDDLVASTCRR